MEQTRRGLVENSKRENRSLIADFEVTKIGWDASQCVPDGSVSYPAVTRDKKFIATAAVSPSRAARGSLRASMKFGRDRGSLSRTSGSSTCHTRALTTGGMAQDLGNGDIHSR